MASKKYNQFSFGTPAATDIVLYANPTTGELHKVTVGDLTAVTPYKKYTALLTQSGTNPPVATVLENTFGGDLVWSRFGAGVYDVTLTGAFDGIFATPAISNVGDALEDTDIQKQSNNVARLTTLDDGIMFGWFLQIYVYPN